MLSDALIKDLEIIINKNLDNIDMPLRKGKKIFIKDYSVFELKDGTFSVMNTTTKKRIAVTSFKASAIAIARNCSKGRKNTREILLLDKELSKHYTDAQFYKNAIKNAKTVDDVEIKSVRLEQSIAMSDKIRSSLNYFIFSH